MSEIVTLINKNTNINDIDIIQLRTFIETSLNKINNNVTIRNRKINFYDLFYFIIKFNIEPLSTYSSCKTLFNIQIGNDVTQSAFVNKLILFDYNHLLKFNNDFIIFYYKQFNLTTNQRLIAIDGSEIQLLYSLNKYFKHNSLKTYTTGYISNLIDIDNNIPISFDIFKSSNERLNLINQLKYINKNDILVADRGYYSIELINKLISLEINFVFRVKKNNIFILNNTEKTDIKNKLFSKLIKYNYNDKSYNFKILKYSYVETIIDNKCDINSLKDTVDKNNLKINKLKNKNISLQNKINILNVINKNINKMTKNEKKKNNNNLIINRKDKKIIKNEINDIYKLKLSLIEENVKNLKLINKLIDYEQSSYFILTNLNIENEAIKTIYKKRWGVETCFKHCKTRLKMNNYDTKNFNIIKQNIYATQYILILESFLEKSIKIKKNFYLNKNDAFKIIDNCLIILLIYQTSNKNEIKSKRMNNKINNKIKFKKKVENINEIINILLLLSKSVIKKKLTIISKERIKKRSHGKNKWISTKKNLIIDT